MSACDGCTKEDCGDCFQTDEMADLHKRIDRLEREIAEFKRFFEGLKQ